MREKAKRIPALCLALLCVFLLSSCRTRTTGQEGTGQQEGENGAGQRTAAVTEEVLPEDDGERSEGESGGRTRENPDASRKEYDESAPVEIVAGTDRDIHGHGEGEGRAADSTEEDAERVVRLNEEAEKPATQVIPAENAEEMGVSEDAEAAESALTYFTVLLKERTESLYECQRLTVYWETVQDHVTVYRTSPEHAMILACGGYDAGARLLEENLTVDDGWVVRKNPGLIIKIVDRSILGSGVADDGAARAVCRGLAAREGWGSIDAVKNGRILILSEELFSAPYLETAAMLMIAKAANSELYEDTDPADALRMLEQEAAGRESAGIFFYMGKGN